MSLAVVAIGVVLLSVPALTARGELGPRAQVLAACLSTASGICLLGVGAILTASPLWLRWHAPRDAPAVGLGHLAPGGPWVWTASGLAFVVGFSWLIVGLRQTVVARRRASLPEWAATSAEHDECAGADVRVAPTLTPFAFAVPGRDRHVVVSEAITRLSTPERRAVLAHEGAHLQLHHDRHLLVLTMYERVWGWVPGVPPLLIAHRHAVEQWADQHAVRGSHVDKQAMLRARSQLGFCCEVSAPVDELRSGSSLRHLVGISLLIGALMAVGSISATHSVGDLTTAVAALH